MGETFEGAGLETGKRAGRELRELVTVLKHPFCKWCPTWGKAEWKLAFKCLRKGRKGEIDTSLQKADGVFAEAVVCCVFSPFLHFRIFCL